MGTTWRKAIVLLLTAALAVTLVGIRAMAGKPTKPAGGPRVIAYRDGDRLVTMDESGGNSFTVVSDREADHLAFSGTRWSPDGLRLGGYEKRVGDGPYDIALMNIRADGTDEQMIVSYAEVDALNVANGKTSIYDSDLDPWAPFGFHGAAWSPDGRFMVFGAPVFFADHSPNVFGISPCLYVVDLWGEEPLRQLTDNPVFFWGDATPHWSPTENKIAFKSYRHDSDGSSHDGLWVINPDGTGMKRVRIGDADLPNGYGWAVWSHQRNPSTGHSQIIVHPANQGPMILDVDLEQDPPKATVLMLPDIQMDSPVWSPDDTRLVYPRRVFPPRGRSYSEIAILDLLTLQEKLLLTTKNAAHSPDWNPVVPTQ